MTFQHHCTVDLCKLFIDVFDPQPAETASVMFDLPHGNIADKGEWRARRGMAERWHKALSALGTERNFEVLPLISFNATGANNGQLPAVGEQEGEPILLEEIAQQVTLLLAMTEFSASAPLIGWSKRFPKLRASSMPRVAPQMRNQPLWPRITRRSPARARVSEKKLAKNSMADIEFSTGDHFRFDFGFQRGRGRLRICQSQPRPRADQSTRRRNVHFQFLRRRPGRAEPDRWSASDSVEIEIVRAKVSENHVRSDGQAARPLGVCAIFFSPTPRAAMWLSSDSV